MPRISNTTGVHHVLILGDDGSQEFILLFLRHSEVIECLGDLASDLIELESAHKGIRLAPVAQFNGRARRPKRSTRE